MHDWEDTYKRQLSTPVEKVGRRGDVILGARELVNGASNVRAADICLGAQDRVPSTNKVVLGLCESHYRGRHDYKEKGRTGEDPGPPAPGAASIWLAAPDGQGVVPRADPDHEVRRRRVCVPVWLCRAAAATASAICATCASSIVTVRLARETGIFLRSARISPMSCSSAF